MANDFPPERLREVHRLIAEFRQVLATATPSGYPAPVPPAGPQETSR